MCGGGGGPGASRIQILISLQSCENPEMFQNFAGTVS